MNEQDKQDLLQVIDLVRECIADKLLDPDITDVEQLASPVREWISATASLLYGRAGRDRYWSFILPENTKALAASVRLLFDR